MTHLPLLPDTSTWPELPDVMPAAAVQETAPAQPEITPPSDETTDLAAYAEEEAALHLGYDPAGDPDEAWEQHAETPAVTLPLRDEDESVNTDDQPLLFGGMQRVINHKGKELVKKAVNPSANQEAILNFLAQPGPPLVVIATAGSGKTTLLEMIARQIGELKQAAPEQTLMLSFSRSIVATLKEKLPKNIAVMSINSLGNRILRENRPEASFDKDKYVKLIREAVDNRNYNAKFRKSVHDKVKQALQITMSNLLEIGVDYEYWLSVMHQYDVPVVYEDRDVYSLVMEIIRQGMEMLLPEGKEAVISYADQTYGPAYHNWKLSQPYEAVLVDEGQDASLAQLNLIQGAVSPTGRIVVVGDRAQAIYGFNGANIESLDDITFYLGATTLPLSVCYRCSERVIALAAHFTDRIEAAPGATEGYLDDITREEMMALIRPGDAILCRVNAPLMREAFRLALAGHNVTVEGRDEIVPGLVKMVKAAATWQGEGVKPSEYDETAPLDAETFTDSLRTLLGKAVRRIKNDCQKTGEDPGMRVAAVEDRALTVKYLLDQRKPATAKELTDQIKKLFAKSKNAITLSTVHRAKGEEYPNVFIIEPDLMPHPRAESEAALRAEQAIMFVAFTRARNGLYFVDGEQSIIPAGLGRPHPICEKIR